MGKRKRRLHSPKYARKYAAVRETYNRLRGVVKEAMADGIITEEEQQQIELAEEQVVKAAATVVDVEVEKAVENKEEKVEKIVVAAEELVEETKTLSPVKKKTKLKQPSKTATKAPVKARKTKRVSKTAKTKG